MTIRDLCEHDLQSYLCCLEEWSDQMKEAGPHKANWFARMRAKGLGVKIAAEAEHAVGMIQYLPIEHAGSRAAACTSSLAFGCTATEARV